MNLTIFHNTNNIQNEIALLGFQCPKTMNNKKKPTIVIINLFTNKKKNYNEIEQVKCL